MRIPLTPRSDWSDELVSFTAELRGSVVGQNSDHPSGANLFATMAGHPDLTIPFLRFNGYLLTGSPLPVAVRELVVLRVAHRRGCAYEWAQHVPLARDAGIDPALVSGGADAPGWSPFEQVLLRATDQLLDIGTVDDDVWAALAEELDRHQLMDLVFVVGTYSMLAMAMRSFDVPLDDDLRPFLPDNG